MHPCTLTPVPEHLPSCEQSHLDPDTRKQLRRPSACGPCAECRARSRYQLAVSLVGGRRRSALGVTPQQTRKTIPAVPRRAHRCALSCATLDTLISGSGVSMHHLELIRQTQQAFCVPDEQVTIRI